MLLVYNNKMLVDDHRMKLPGGFEYVLSSILRAMMVVVGETTAVEMILEREYE